MAETMNTYWNENGKHQKELNRLNGLLPNWGMTDNPYMNLFIIASNIYYDVYNNSGCNLKDNYLKKIEEYITPLAHELKSLRFDVKIETLVRNLKNKEKLEKFLDEVVTHVQDKDLSYDKHTLFFDNEKEELSKTEVEGFSVITFGNEKDYSDWMNFRMKQWNYKLIG
jgi:DNA-dependent RNA polymerase auxiliary subunit epsilon